MGGNEKDHDAPKWADYLSSSRDALALAAIVGIFIGYVYRYERLEYLGLDATQFSSSITDEIMSVYQVVLDEWGSVAIALAVSFLILLALRYCVATIVKSKQQGRQVLIVVLVVLAICALPFGFHLADSAARDEVRNAHTDPRRTSVVVLSQHALQELCSNDPQCKPMNPNQIHSSADQIKYQFRLDLADVLGGQSLLLEENEHALYFLVMDPHDPPRGHILALARDDISALLEDPRL